MTATYSPDDNKLRLYPDTRLDPDTYARVKAAGFVWAPKQQLFVAPRWTPDRADLLLDLCGDIGDDDTSLVDRAEERAERFTEYHESRKDDAQRAYDQTHTLMNGIPMGQPILVGHHSERHARKDAERIDNGLRKAVRLWDTAKYWRSRAAGAIRHAKYKERPDVRHRRIRGLESDRRAFVARYAPSSRVKPQVWNGEEHVWCSLGSRGGSWVKTSDLPAIQAEAARWIAHIDLRLEYERAMLAESGGLGVDQAAIPVQVGGRVRIGAEWCTVLRLNRKDGQLVSVTTNRRYGRVVGIEAIAEVQAPDPDVVTAVKASQTKAPLCNYPGEGFVTMTKAEWERTYRDYKGTREIAQTLTHGAHRVRSIVRGYKGLDYVYVSDLPRKDAPVAAHPIKPDEDEGEGDDPCPACGRERRGGPCGCGGDVVPPPEPALDIRGEAARLQASNDRREAARAEAAPFEALRQAAKTGVQVVAAPQLFPTPAPLAERMIDALGIEKGHRILEPSAGTGNLVWEIARRWSLETDISLIAVEMNPTLADRLERTFPDVWVQAVDFLQVAPRDPEMIGPRDTAPVDRIVMNPPFAGAQDIRHIRHAYEFLKPGGRLVALCADGPRQRDVLKPWAEGQGGTYDSLPEGTFSAQGTQVRVALLVVDHD